jgi:Family of unknown function (DUF6499)
MLYCAAFTRHVSTLAGGSNSPSQYPCGDHTMPSAPDWRSASAYAYLHELNAAEFAAEFLRRNPAYRRDYRVALKRARDERSTARAYPLGLAISLSTQTSEQTAPLRFGCRILLLRSFFSRPRQRDSVKRAALPSSSQYSIAPQATANTELSAVLRAAPPSYSSAVPRLRRPSPRSSRSIRISLPALTLRVASGRL